MRRLWLPLIVLVTGLCASLQSWRLLDRYETKLAEATLVAQSDIGVTAIERSFSSSLNDLRAISGMFECADVVTPDDFKVFCAPILNQRDGPFALAWVPLNSDRQHRAGNLPAGPAQPSFEPYAIAYIEPYHRRESFRSRQLAADPAIREALVRARTTGQIAISQTSPIDGDTSGVAAVLSIRGADVVAEHEQVFGKDPRGLLVGFYCVEDIVERATRGFGCAGIEVALVDRSASEDGQVLYSCGLRPSGIRAGSLPSGSDSAASAMPVKRFA